MLGKVYVAIDGGAGEGGSDGRQVMRRTEYEALRDHNRATVTIALAYLAGLAAIWMALSA